jgi:hypothetical protein
MQKIIRLTILSLLIANQVNSQTFNMGIQTGIGSYSMLGLKDLNKTVIPNLSFKAKLVSDFPPYFYYRPEFMIRYNNLNIGLVYSFQSTGSRISSKDYSGVYHFDMIVNSHTPGFKFDVDFTTEKRFRISLYSILGVSFSNLKISEYFRVSDSVLIDNSIRFKSMNYFLEPGLTYKYPYKSFVFGINVGYLIPFGNEAFYTNNNKNNKLYNESNREFIKPDWNGFRLGISVTFNFISKNN